LRFAKKSTFGRFCTTNLHYCFEASATRVSIRKALQLLSPRLSFSLSSEGAAMHRSRGRTGFTLVELLVVIAIIGVLVALLLPAIQAAREAARRAQCQNNLKQIGLGVLNFESAKKRFPAGATAEGSSTTAVNSSTWTVDILPFAEQQALYSLWTPTQDFNAAVNQRLRESYVPLYTCPTDIDTKQLYQPDSGQGTGQFWAPGSYRGVSGWVPNSIGGSQYWDDPRSNTVGIAGVLPDWSRGPLPSVLKNISNADDRKLPPVSTRQITDGTSNTLLAGEYHTTTNPSPTQARRTLWCYAYTSYNVSSGVERRPETLNTDFNACAALEGGDANGCKRAWGSLHTGNIIQFVRCDGSAATVSMNLDMALFVTLVTISGDEQVPNVLQ
jgi:prepilin-type N-terminal cleavage/methylation domain-containing protein